MHWCMWTQHICTVTYKCLEEGGEMKGEKTWSGEGKNKKKKQRGQAGENDWEEEKRNKRMYEGDKG